MTRRVSQRRVALLRGTVKWLPVIALPFAVFFFETWLQVRIYERGYAAKKILRDIKDVEAHIDRLQERIDDLTALKHVSEEAPDLGLVPIQPGQVEVIYAPPASRPAPPSGEKPIAIANADVQYGAP